MENVLTEIYFNREGRGQTNICEPASMFGCSRTPFWLRPCDNITWVKYCTGAGYLLLSTNIVDHRSKPASFSTFFYLVMKTLKGYY